MTRQFFKKGCFGGRTWFNPSLTKKLTLAMWIACSLAVIPTTQARQNSADPVLKTGQQKLSYALGMNLGSILKSNKVSPDVEAIARGITTGLTGAKPLLTPEAVLFIVYLGRDKSNPPKLLPGGDGDFKSAGEKVGYADGINYAPVVKDATMTPDMGFLMKGAGDVLSGGKPLLSEDESKTLLGPALSKEADRKTERDQKMLTAGEDFLATNKSEPGVVTMTNGLQCKILVDGHGEKPELTNTINVNYRGTFIDGTHLDASAPGQPTPFPLNRLIKAYKETVPLMGVGSKWRVFAPPPMAYGSRGRPEIPPNATLIFDIELVSIKHPPGTTYEPPK